MIKKKKYLSFIKDHLYSIFSMLIYYWNKLLSEKWIEQKTLTFYLLVFWGLIIFSFAVILVSCIERSEDLILSK